jgi:murein DD-endopeptidase MepM/ murein hydrolase activator NlpD
MKYKIIVNITLLFTFFTLCLTSSLQAESPVERAKAVKAKMATMRGNLSSITKKYVYNADKLDDLRNKISVNKEKLKKATANLVVNQRRINKRAGNMYRYDKATVLDVVFSSKSLDDLIVSWDFINLIGSRDGEVIKKVKRLRAEIKKAQKELVKAEKTQRRVVNDLASEKGQIEASLDKQKKMMSGIEGEIEKLNRMPKTVGVVSTSGWVFPVASPYSFSNDWHAQRVGHLHQGNDIFTSYGNPTYAVVSGSVSNMSGGKAGMWQSLHGDDGNTYYYMHQSRFAASGRVSQGQVIGYAGNSGNAAGGATHVHFEFHPGGGGAINPYPYLIAVQ